MTESHSLKSSRDRADVLELPYHSFRNITCPEDEQNDRKVYAGHLPVEAILGLPTDENVREYLVDPDGKQRRATTSVHRAIRETLDQKSHLFSVLNGGIVFVARDVEVDDKARLMWVLKPSIINGSQTQGVIRDWIEHRKNNNLPIEPVHIKYELIVADDDALIAETSISRNNQNDVKQLSIVGRLGYLDELEKALAQHDDNIKLRKSETDLSPGFIDTEKLIQVITALVPEELWGQLKPKEQGNPNKVYTYSMKAKCLKDFREIYQAAKNKEHKNHAVCAEIYQFFLDIAPTAWDLYHQWRRHQGFSGTGIRNGIERAGRQVMNVQDGIIFPIVAAHSAFMFKQRGKWGLRVPQAFDEDQLIAAAIRAFQEIASSNPWLMGKSKACYSATLQITSIYRALAEKQQTH